MVLPEISRVSWQLCFMQHDNKTAQHVYTEMVSYWDRDIPDTNKEMYSYLVNW